MLTDTYLSLEQLPNGLVACDIDYHGDKHSITCEAKDVGNKLVGYFMMKYGAEVSLEIAHFLMDELKKKLYQLN